MQQIDTGTEMPFVANGRKYAVDEFGVVVQKDNKPFTYDKEYCKTYDTPEYKVGSDILQALRLGFVHAAHARPIGTIIDIGYGNGAFMRAARSHISFVHGYDVSGVPVPEECIQLEEEPWLKKVNVVTFWDVLEHFVDIEFLGVLSADTIVVSLPFCHFHTQGLKWFENQYKHLKPDEHIRHFNIQSLEKMMWHYGWRKVAFSTHEDIVRKSPGHWPNILTMAFKRRDTKINL